MRYHLLGRSGLRVSELCLGTMTFGEDWGWGASKDASRAMFDAFADAGGNFIDTANVYTDGTSEAYVGEFVGSERDRFVIATKYTGNLDPADPNAGGNHRKSLTRAVEGSLRRLGTDYIDLLWVHMWDHATPVEEVMRALDDLVASGKVLYVGVSDTPAWIVSEANMLADLRGWSRFVGLQIEYSLVERTPERDLLPMAQSRELTVLDWSPLASGALTGKYLGTGPAGDGSAGDGAAASDGGEGASGEGASGGESVSGGSEGGPRLAVSDPEIYAKYKTERARAIARTVVEVASDLGRSPAQVALAWIRQQANAHHIPIVGARTPAHIEDNLGCLDLTLADDHLARLDTVSAIDLGFPHAFLTADMMKGFMFGEQAASMDARYGLDSRIAH